MAIDAYTGLPGSGKSYSVTEHVILPALEAGRVVVTNVSLQMDVIESEYPGADVRMFEVGAQQDRPNFLDIVPPGGVLVVDEAWSFWPAGMQAKNILDEDKEFLTMHRHRVDTQGRSQQIVLVTQGLGQIAAMVRNLVDTHFRSVNMKHVGAARKFRIDVYRGASEKETDRLRQIFGTYRETVWRYYKSHTQSDAVGTDEASMDRRGNIFASNAFRLGVPLGIAAFFGFVMLAWSSMEGALVHEKEEPAPQLPAQRASGPSPVVSAVGVVQVAPVVQREPAQPVVPEWSYTWRLVGVMSWEDRPEPPVAYVVGRSGMRQIDHADCEYVVEWVCKVDGESVTVWTGPDRFALGKAPGERI